ncbi:hypothetical protein [Clostridium sp. Marseille-P3244]|uniref:hypothetical protein n=1 Tax=Clostridium sp. Marseille-P3244 TaxID=1871020 RepID=UPI000930525C|nr:hypothetical protein [Clostridium sp. Marseille-P3244]
MRLIDADEFCRYTDEHCQDDFAELWKELIRRQPTAFDKEKVMNKLTGLQEAERSDSDEEPELIDGEDIYDEGRSQGRFEAYHNAINIVEKGGIE